MNLKLINISVDDLKDLISNVVEEKIEEVVEELKSISDLDYIKSIEEARKEYKEGKVTDVENILIV
jgi:beta-lactam-binding protein with PASTA domain